MKKNENCQHLRGISNGMHFNTTERKINSVAIRWIASCKYRKVTRAECFREWESPEDADVDPDKKGNSLLLQPADWLLSRRKWFYTVLSVACLWQLVSVILIPSLLSSLISWDGQKSPHLKYFYTHLETFSNSELVLCNRWMESGEC